MSSLAVERNRSRAIHGIQVLFDFESCRTLLLNNGKRAVAVSAESFHRLGVEDGAVGAAGKGKRRQDLSIFGTQNDHLRLRWNCGWVSGPGTRREQHAEDGHFECQRWKDPGDA